MVNECHFCKWTQCLLVPALHSCSNFRLGGGNQQYKYRQKSLFCVSLIYFWSFLWVYHIGFIEKKKDLFYLSRKPLCFGGILHFEVLGRLWRCFCVLRTHFRHEKTNGVPRTTWFPGRLSSSNTSKWEPTTTCQHTMMCESTWLGLCNLLEPSNSSWSLVIAICWEIVFRKST